MSLYDRANTSNNLYEFCPVFILGDLKVDTYSFLNKEDSEEIPAPSLEDMLDVISIEYYREGVIGNTCGDYYNLNRQRKLRLFAADMEREYRLLAEEKGNFLCIVSDNDDLMIDGIVVTLPRKKRI